MVLEVEAPHLALDLGQLALHLLQLGVQLLVLAGHLLEAPLEVPRLLLGSPQLVVMDLVLFFPRQHGGTKRENVEPLHSVLANKSEYTAALFTKK